MRLSVYSESTFFGGGEELLATLLGGLDERIEVTVVGTSGDVAERLASARGRADVVTLDPVHGRRDLRGMGAHLAAVRELRPDVLQANGNPWVCQYALASGVLTPGVRTLALHHIVTPPASRGQLLRCRWYLRRVDAHVSVFTEGARRLERMIGRPEGSTHVIHNGVKDETIEPRERAADGLVVGTVGRFAPQKGQDVLLSALAGLPDVTAVLVGDGEDRAALERMAERLGVGDRVVMPGWMADPRPWLPTFDLFVLPSRVEGLPLVIIEAMLAELPVVATRVDGIPEEVVDGRTGWLVPPDDPAALRAAVRSLLDDPERRRRMGREGRERALRRFSVERMVSAYESLYEELVPGAYSR